MRSFEVVGTILAYGSFLDARLPLESLRILLLIGIVKIIGVGGGGGSQTWDGGFLLNLEIDGEAPY